MMRSDQEDSEYDDEDSCEDSEEESDEADFSSEDEEDMGFTGSRYAAVDQIMRDAAGSSTDRAGGPLERAVTWPAGQVFGRSALRRSSEPSGKSVWFAEELAETQEFPVVFSWSDSDSSPANPHRNMLEQMDINPEALAKAEAAVFSSSRSPVTATETESPEEVRDAADDQTCGEPERVEPMESENQLPGLDEAVVDMAPEATGADEVGALQESSSFATTVAELGVQSYCAEDEDVPQTEHKPADGANVLSPSVLEVKQGLIGMNEEDGDPDQNIDGSSSRADCAVQSAPGQHSHSDVTEAAIQQPTWRKTEGLLLQPPPEADDGTPAAEDSWFWLSWIMAHMCCGPRLPG